LDRPKKKEAVKKVIAAMTVGKDVSMLFPHVVNCMQTEDLELKKLVYLYLINYAKTQPDLAIMAVNTFVKVSTHDHGWSCCWRLGSCTGPAGH
jgi:AP-1 complex subunit beta-1